ncbi:MAG: hypothetical protein MUC87_18865 [Bacteroidia bacterium]|jgi:hypothetical protein|nr:hypothetical protein [Bacteroidia bacterium]
MAIYYKSSGKAPVTGTLLALAAALVLGILCAFIYCYAIWYIPIIYLNIVIIIGVPFALSWLMARLAIKPGKIRNKMMAGLMGLAAGVVFFVMQWALHCVMVTNSGEVHSIGSGSHELGFAETGFSLNALLFYLFNPSETFTLIGIINEVGTWGIKSSTVSGVMLTICWVVEALIILLLPMYLPYKQAANPFSEKLNQWLNTRKLSRHIEITNSADELRNEIDQGNFATLSQAGTTLANPFRRLVIHSDDQLQEIYLTVQQVTLSHDNKGNEKEDEKVEVKEVLIPRQLYDNLVAQFG